MNENSRRIWNVLKSPCKSHDCLPPKVTATLPRPALIMQAFYAATALLLVDGFEHSKHSGVIAGIHQRFVKTGKLDKQRGRDLNWLFELRSIGDYGETQHVPAAEAARAVEAADTFLQAVKKLLGRDPEGA